MKACAVVALLACLACGKGETPVPAQPRPAPTPVAVEKARSAFVSVKGAAFVDQEGRQLLLHGMAVIGKGPNENYQSWHGPEDFQRMREWGMNCIRLGIIWDGIEPRPGEFDDVSRESR